MNTSRSREEIINQVRKWPEVFRAHLDTGVWYLLGAGKDVQQEFRLCAERILREFCLPAGNTCAVDALLYRLKERGDHVTCSQRAGLIRLPMVGTVVANNTHAIISPLRSALGKYLHHAQRLDSSAPAIPRSPGDRWQAAAARMNREQEERMRILRGFQSLGYARRTSWPDFVRDFETHMRDKPENRQLVSPPPFQPRPFDRLNQSPGAWMRLAEEEWTHHRDRFLRGCQFWVAVGVDHEVRTATPVRGSGVAVLPGKRGRNSDVEQRYRWAAEYMLRIPLKVIAGRYGADPSTVGRTARAILRRANWYQARKTAKL